MPKMARLTTASLLLGICIAFSIASVTSGIADRFGMLVSAELLRWSDDKVKTDGLLKAFKANRLGVTLAQFNSDYHLQSGQLFQVCAENLTACPHDKHEAQILARDAFAQAAALSSDNDEAKARYLLMMRNLGDLSGDFKEQYHDLLKQPLSGVPARVLFVQLTTSVWPILDAETQRQAIPHLHRALISDIKVVNQNAWKSVKLNTHLLGKSFADQSSSFVYSNPGKPSFRIVFTFWRYWEPSARQEIVKKLSGWAEAGFSGEIFSAAQENQSVLLACSLLPRSNRFERFCTDKRIKNNEF
jgi:hypothetical protein